MLAEAGGKVIVVLSVPATVMLLLAVKVLPSAIVSVDPVAGAVNATLFIVVADATPSVGVVNTGDVDKTVFPEPVDVVTPVPPLATLSVPASVTVPLDALLGVNPVVPALKVVTLVIDPN
jgi:hypothetical protein